MTAKLESLWGALPTELPATPKSLLLDQIIALNALTGGKLSGRVVSEPVSIDGSPEVLHRFLIVAPALSNYSVEILMLFHPPVLYPARLRGAIDVTRPRIMKDEAQLKGGLQEILQSKSVHDIIRGLLAQIADSGAPKTSSLADIVLTPVDPI